LTTLKRKVRRLNVLKCMRRRTLVLNVKFCSIACPTSVEAADRCEKISATVNVVYSGDNEDFSSQMAAFEKEISDAIDQQQLQESLNDVNREAPVWGLNGGNNAPGDSFNGLRSIENPSSENDLSSGGIAGIVAASLLTLCCLLCICGVFGRRREANEKTGEGQSVDTASDDAATATAVAAAVATEDQQENHPSLPEYSAGTNHMVDIGEEWEESKE